MAVTTTEEIHGIEKLNLNDGIGHSTQTQCGISTHSFQTTFEDNPVFFLVTRLGNSLMIWIGGADGRLNELAYSAKTPYDKGQPISTQLITAGDTTSSTLAARLTKKLGKPVFVSYNLSETSDGSLFKAVQLRLLEELEKQPSKF